MIQEKSTKEFEDILVERDVVGGLNELERLIGEAKAKKEKGGKAQLPLEPCVLIMGIVSLRKVLYTNYSCVLL